MIQTIFSKTIVISVSHYIGVFLLSKKNEQKITAIYEYIGNKHICRKEVSDKYTTSSAVFTDECC